MAASAAPSLERAPGYEPLRSVKLGDVRAVFSPGCYARSTGRALAGFLFDFALYGIALAGVFRAGNPAVQLACGVAAGLAVAFLFVWAHDAAHGALFAGDGWAEVLGTAAMLPSLQIYRLWVHGHNRVHHGFTSLSSIDWIWRPWSPAEYAARPPSARLLYRLERHPATVGLHYLIRVWWAGMVRFRPDRTRPVPGAGLSKLGTLGFAGLLGAAGYRFAGGWLGVVAAVVVPFLVFTYVISLVVYLHHTHPDVPFFDDRREWSPTIGQLACSTVVRAHPVVERLTHHILIHPPHHIDTRIPYYRLEQAYADLRPAFGGYVTEYRLTPSAVRRIFRHCQLYDFETHTWHRFPGRDFRP